MTSTMLPFTPVFDDIARQFGVISAAVYGRIWRYCQGDSGLCTASATTIGSALGLTERCVRGQAHMLVAAGYLQIVAQDKGRPVTYTLATPEQRSDLLPRNEIPATPESASGHPGTKFRPPRNAVPTKRVLREVSNRQVVEGGALPASPDPLWTSSIEDSPRPHAKPSPLDPDTPAARLFFDRILANARAAGRKLPKPRFRTLEQKKKFDRAAQSLGGEFPAALDLLFEQGIVEVTRGVNYLAGIDRHMPGNAPSAAPASRLTPTQQETLQRKAAALEAASG